MLLESLDRSIVEKISTISIISLHFFFFFLNPWEDKGAHN